MEIVVGFSRPKKWLPLAKLIMLCEGTGYSHAFIKIRSESLDRNLIYQATGSGVFFIGEPAFEDHAVVVEEFSLDVSADKKKQLLQWAIDMSGKPYGVTQILGIAVKRAFALFGVSIKNPFASGTKAFICTELVARATEELGYKLDKDLDEVGLRDLRDYLTSIK